MQKIRFTLLFLGCALLGISVGAALTLLTVYLLGDIRKINELPKFVQQVSQLPNWWYIFIFVQAVSHLFSYLVPALAYWYYFEHARWTDFQKVSLKSVSVLWMGLISVVFIMPFNELVIEWNQHLELPKTLSIVEHWMRRKEYENNLFTNQLLAIDSVEQLIGALLVIGLIASVGEEIFFRGVIQRKLIEWTTNVHYGIWLAAILFSAAHFQFYGFFPRLLLGVLFGYLYLWSGNIWVSILAHFINNGIVIITIFIQRQPPYHWIRSALDTSTWLWITFSVIGSTILLFYFYRINLRATSNMYYSKNKVL